MLNNFDVFCNHLVLTGSSPRISVERFQLSWIQFLLKKSVSTLPNTLAARIFVRVKIGNWH